MSKKYAIGDLVYLKEHPKSGGWNGYRVAGPVVGGRVRLTEINKFGDAYSTLEYSVDQIEGHEALAIGDTRVTRGGTEVIVIAFDPDGNPIVKSKFGGVYIVATGDLFPVSAKPKVRKVGYGVVYDDGLIGARSHLPLAEADLRGNENLVGILKVTTETNPDTGKARLVSAEVI